MDPDPDSGGSKTYGSVGSESATLCMPTNKIPSYLREKIMPEFSFEEVKRDPTEKF
jgi:hypothetical protein